jgi:UDP-2-acetamido-3-amino-2,3-dideoxy-glucuronate N-acetyltransferase
MSKGKLSIGLIGIGYWGKNIARNLYDLGFLDAIYDNNELIFSELKNTYPNVRIFKNIDDLIDYKIDAVFIATPAETHGKLVKIFLNKNIHVFVEKPLCLNVKEGNDLKKLAEQKGLKLMVGHLLLYHPAFISLKNIVESGGLGKLRYIYSNRLSLGKLRKEENALWSFAPHDISMILSLIGSEPTKIEASGGYYLNNDVADTTMTFLHFKKGIKAHIFVSWLNPYKDQRLVVIGEKAMATFIDVEEKEKKLLLYNHDVAWDGNIPVIEKAEGVVIKYDMSKEPLKEECKSFINWVCNDIKPPSDASEGLRVLKVLDIADNELKRKRKYD